MLLIILIVLLLLFGYGGYRMGPGIGYYGGGGISLILLIVVILLLPKLFDAANLRSRDSGIAMLLGSLLSTLTSPANP